VGGNFRRRRSVTARPGLKRVPLSLSCCMYDGIAMNVTRSFCSSSTRLSATASWTVLASDRRGRSGRARRCRPACGVTAILTFASRRLGFARADEITVVFCGSKKSLASGLPIATLLFAGHVGLVVMLLVLFHQIQLTVCASLAQHYAARGATANGPLPGLAATSAWTCDIIATIPHRRD
jgi:predicted Na+-dependent transporter